MTKKYSLKKPTILVIGSGDSQIYRELAKIKDNYPVRIICLDEKKVEQKELERKVQEFDWEKLIPALIKKP